MAEQTSQTINLNSSTTSQTQENPPPTSDGPQNPVDPNQGYFNPFCIHHNDNSSLILVTEPLTEENYVSWSRGMIIGLFIKNKLGFSDGSLSRPNDDSLPSWIRNNNIVISWILN
ncbi:uncharacterized protein LOC105434731 [Cucumis sativus]|uniref:uncharacterized protein LOC105434731 n=1 Tax=Cucumis sativus TaxID=3659 RepID=UPI0005ED0073|nr:uncharacterized protein LOC105434731 [Cucumis sativus]